jgi:hypothetical protein
MFDSFNKNLIADLYGHHIRIAFGTTEEFFIPKQICIFEWIRSTEEWKNLWDIEGSSYGQYRYDKIHEIVSNIFEDLHNNIFDALKAKNLLSNKSKFISVTMHIYGDYYCAIDLLVEGSKEITTVYYENHGT